MMSQYNIDSLLKRTPKQMGLYCRVYDKKRNLAHYRFAFKITKDEGVKGNKRWTTY